jgi:queuosine precursor transporter
LQLLFESAAYSIPHLIKITLSIWITKTIIEIIGIPISVRLAKLIKRKENLDIYDYHTNYNPMSLDSDYKAESNKFSISKTYKD